MYGKLITREEAAELLGVKVSTIGHYWRTGKLSYKIVHRKRRCILDEVINLMDSRNHLSNRNIRDEFVRLKYRVNSLESIVEHISKKLDMQQTFVLSDKDLALLYSLAKDGSPRRISPEAAKKWAETLGGFGESEYSRLKNLTKDAFPWAVFMNFIDTLSKRISSRRDFKESFSWNHAFLELQVAKEQVKKMGKLVFHEEGGAFMEEGADFVATLNIEEDEPAKLKLPS